jgi:hypothetical protein
MAFHRIEYSYKIPEWGVLDDVDMDEFLDYSEKEAIALADIKDTFDDIEDIEITKIEVTAS